MSEFDVNVWKFPPGELQIFTNEVHIWKAEVQPFRQSLDLFASWLSEEETQRWQRYQAADVRDRFLTARGLLRGIISFYTGQPQVHLSLAVSTFGKPYLSFPRGTGLEFSLSHSSECILLAFSIGLPLGIDVEKMQQDIDFLMISSKYFSRSENQSILQLPQLLQKQAFFNCWTRKEAYLKGLGAGMHASLTDFSVSVSPNEPAVLLNPLPAYEEGDPWQLFAIDPKTEYAAAAAVQSIQKLDLVFWKADPDWLRGRFS
jgi:4'-phosphopantetheinyl transferase